MLTIKNVSAVIDAIDLLKNISLDIKPGEIHAIMGPEKSGKSSLAHLIAGHPSIIQTEGSITFNNKNLAKLDSDDRASLGIQITFQEPPEIAGLTNFELAKLLLKSKNDKRSDQEIERDYKVLCSMLELPPYHGSTIMDYDLMSKSEYRKNELLLILLADPKLAIIDEIDTDLDEDDLAIVGAVLSSFSSNKNSIAIITHNKKLLDMVCPTHVHIIVDGEIKAKGDSTLYKRIEEDGYSQFS